MSNTIISQLKGFDEIKRKMRKLADDKKLVNTTKERYAKP